MVAAERALIVELRTRALELKRRAVSAEDAGKQVSEDLKKAHPDWPNTNARPLSEAFTSRKSDCPLIRWLPGS